MLQFNTKQEILAGIPGQGKHINFLFQDSLDDNLDFKPDVDPEHPLKKVCDFIDKTFHSTNKNQEFNLGEKLAPLSKAPYGLYQSYSGMGMVAYAMRKWVKQIFALDGKPREARQIVDDVVEMFKVWEEGKKSNKLNFMFESKESTSLCKSLISIFKLNQLPGYKDVSSLTDARWAVLEYAKRQGYPLWALKYSGCSESMAHLIENLVKICDPDGLSNQELIGDASKAIKKLELDLNILLVEDDVFKRGFLKFLKMDSKVNLKDEEFEDIYTYLTTHLQGEIGRWTESEVQLQEVYWRMEKEQKPNPPTPPTPTPPSPYPPSTGNGNGSASEPSPEELAKHRNEATEQVNNITDDALREAIIKMIQNENKQVIDIVMKYVQ